MKKLVWVLGFSALIAFVVLGKNAIAKVVIENGVRIATGLRLQMGQFSFSLTRSFVGIEDLKLYNPHGYADPLMADLPEIYVDYELAPLLKGNAHVEELRIHLKEFVVVRNEKGELNVNALKPVQAQQKGVPAPQAPAGKQGKPAGKASEIHIDKLKLQMEKVIFKDYSKGGTPSVKEYNLNLNEEYRNIKNLNLVVSLIVLKVMMGTPLAALTNFDVDSLHRGVTETLANSQKLANEAAAKAGDYLKQVDLDKASGTLDESARELTEGLKNVAGSLKQKFSNPLSKR